MRQLLCNGGSIFFTRKVKNLEEMIRGNYLNDRQKLVIEIEQFQIQHMERPCKYDSLKKSIKDQIKVTYNWLLTHKKQLIHVLKVLSVSVTDIFYFR